MLDLQPYVLRYWQTEFRALAAKKAGGTGGDFSAGDLETIRRIKELLYDEGYTIASAKKKIAAELEDGRLRGRPLTPIEEDEPEDGPPAAGEAEETTEKAAAEPPAVSPEEKADAGTPAASRVEEAAPADATEEESPSSGAGQPDSLARRLEALEEGVAAAAAEARRLAAELSPEASPEGD